MFLPVISVFLALLTVLFAACGQGGMAGSTPIAPSQANAAEPLPRVVAGTGEPSPETVALVRRVVEDQLPGLLQVFPRRLDRPFFVFVHANRDELPAEMARNLHTDSPGFAMLGRHQIHLVWGEMRRTGSSLPGVVTHELVHELLDQFVAPNGNLVPRWFHEGLAQLLAGDTYLGAREEDLVWRVAARRLFAFGDLRSAFPADRDDLQAAYAQSFSYVSWLVGEYGLQAMLAVAAAADDLTSFERALVGRTGRSTLQLEDAWRYHLLNQSGAPWRVALDQCFSLLVIGALPVLALALIRRLAAERRVAERLERSEASAATPADPTVMEPSDGIDETIEERPSGS